MVNYVKRSHNEQQGVGMLFGHQNNDVIQPVADSTPAVQVEPTLNPLAVDPSTGVSLPVAPEESTAADGPVSTSMLTPPPPPSLPVPPLPVPSSAPAVTSSTPMPEPLAIPEPPVAAPAIDPTPEPAEPTPLPEPEPVMPLDVPEPVPAPTPGGDDLIDIKQQALAQLTPLVDQLDQSPEEKFRTKMMMIQSTDDQSLIKDAYDAALAITEEKSRAQALLDIINEINYFTTPHPDQQ